MMAPALCAGAVCYYIPMSFELTKDYKDYIKSPRWKQTCARYWAVYGKKCQACGARMNLHVHHMSYENFKNEPLADLCGLCQTCHRKVHSLHRINRSASLRLVTMKYVAARRATLKK